MHEAQPESCFVAVQLANELFGVTVEPASNEHTWHPDVKFFSLKRDGRQKAYFYLDPYSRPAGMHPCVTCNLRIALVHLTGRLAVTLLSSFLTVRR